MIKSLYEKFLLGYPRLVLLFIAIILSFLAYKAFDLKVDASAKTLVIEGDKDLEYSREVYNRYKSKDLLVIAYTPKNYILDDKTLKKIKEISDNLRKIPHVYSVTSILDLPLLQFSQGSFAELADGAKTLSSKGVKKQDVKNELINNPLYIENFVSKDFKTTSIMINLKDYKSRELNHQTIKQVRSVIKKHKANEEMFLGGANMIADDMITYVKNDIKNYGVIVFTLLVLILYIVFKEVKWVVLPVVVLLSSVIASAGVLGLFDWNVTVVSSNFVSFQLILTMSIIVHLIVRYRELSSQTKHLDQKKLVLDTVSSMSKPTFFAVITTIAGFTSLVFSELLPVINLGWMMATSLVLSFVLTYVLFGSIMLLVKPSKPNITFEKKYAIPKLLSNIVQKHYISIYIASIIIIVFSISGASKLVVENSFINYFKQSTEIYQGMSLIDQKLGGTTPLDVTIDLYEDTDHKEVLPHQAVEDDMLSGFEDEFENETDEKQYWFTTTKMKKIEKIHNYLESIPELGKVLSFGTVLKVGKAINNDKDLGNFELGLLYNEFPDDLKDQILKPYLNIEANQVRFSIRIVDSNPDLRRDELLKKIKQELHEKIGIKKEHIHLSGLMVLYNNMLQSLFDSQIKTLSIMVLLLFSMFWILFRSFKIAVAAIVANIIPVGIVFGFMGYSGTKAIPLSNTRGATQK